MSREIAIGQSSDIGPFDRTFMMDRVGFLCALLCLAATFLVTDAGCDLVTAYQYISTGPAECGAGKTLWHTYDAGKKCTGTCESWTNVIPADPYFESVSDCCRVTESKTENIQLSGCGNKVKSLLVPTKCGCVSCNV